MDVTLQDIARELDLSPATVSRSLRHDTAVNAQTRARVNEAARLMGYSGGVGRPRRQAEPETKVRIMGLLLRHDSLEAAHHDVALMQMMAGIMSVLDQHDMHLKVHTWPGQEQPHLDEDPEEIPSILREGACQAVITHGYHEERNLTFLANRIPVVTMGRHYRNLPIDAAVGDNVDGVHRLVTHLAELGHRRLAWVGSFHTWSFTESRQAGFLQGCLQHGLEVNPHYCFGPEIWDDRDIRDKDVLLQAVAQGVTGFVCSNSWIALDLVNILEAAGILVPQAVSVTGFDYIPTEVKIRRPIAIDPGFFQIGRAAARLAVQRMANPTEDAHVVYVRGKFLDGDTTGPAPQTAS